MNTMRQFRINRTNALWLGLGMAGFCGVSYGAEVPLIFGNEDVAAFSTLQVNKTPSEATQTTTLRVLRPTLCGRTSSQSPPAGFRNRINPTFAGFYAGGDFKFGLLNGGNPLSTPGIGFWNYRPNGLQIQADPETLCYVLDSAGVRKASAGLFNDSFDGIAAGPDASITTSVAQLPNDQNGFYYRYYIDVRIPAEFQGMFYSVRDGFDSSVFGFGGQAALHCPPAPIGTTALCASGSRILNSVDYSLVVPPGGVAQRYIVQRQLHAASLPADTATAVTYAALFLPDGAEHNLANNVSAGRGTLSDLAPIIVASPTMVPALDEGQGVTGLSFEIADDTNETGLPQLSASVVIDFNGNPVAGRSVNCSQVTTPQSGEAIRRVCTFDMPVFDPDFATDPVTRGIYAPGVQASVRITATDSRGQTSTHAVPFHVLSTNNDAPTFTLSPLAVPDPTNGNIATLHCDYGAGEPFPPQCTGDIPNFITNGKPGPTHAYDELATQWTLFAGVGADNKLECSGTTPSIFSMVLGVRQSPRVVPAGSSAGINYQISGEAGSALCTIYYGDGAYPLTQSYNQTVKQFRIVVTK